MQDLAKIKAYIGFAAKARKVVFGVDNIVTHNPRKLKVIIVDDRLSPKSTKNLEFYAETNEIPCHITKIDIEDILKKKNCRVIAIKDSNLAKAIVENLD